MSDEASKLLVQAAKEVGWAGVPEGSVAQIEKWCKKKLALIAGGQDRDHAINALRSAIEAAEEGNYPYVKGGMKVAHQATRGHI